MKIQEVILRAMDGRLKGYQVAELLGISDRKMPKLQAQVSALGP